MEYSEKVLNSIRSVSKCVQQEATNAKTFQFQDCVL